MPSSSLVSPSTHSDLNNDSKLMLLSSDQQGQRDHSYLGFGQSIDANIGAVSNGSHQMLHPLMAEEQNSQASAPFPNGSESPLPRYSDDPPTRPTDLRSIHPAGVTNLDDAGVMETDLDATFGDHEPLLHAVVESDSRIRTLRDEVESNRNEIREIDPAVKEEEPKYARVDLKSKRNSKAPPGESRNGTPRIGRKEQGCETDPIRIDSSDERTGFLPNHPSFNGILSASRCDINDPSQVSSVNNLRTKREVREDPSVNVQEAKKFGNDSLQAVVTALYCKVLVILGLAFPMAEVISEKVTRGYYQLFYVCLFLGSLLFLLFIYVDLLRTRARHNMPFLRRKVTKEEVDISKRLPVSESGGGQVPRPRVQYGSFYLRLGAVLFGVGSMIYSGIEIGMFFELSMSSQSCQDLFATLRPILQMTFVFVQMYFIFLNQKMNIYKNKFLSRFGLMHMIATNLCVWLNVLILETSHEILGAKHGNVEGTELQASHPTSNHSAAHQLIQKKSSMDGFHPKHMVSVCHRQDNIMSKLLSDSGPFLFPCTIEYSLICAAVLFVMWKNIAEEHEHYKFQRRRQKIFTASTNNLLKPLEQERSAHHYSVDCTHANTGLFTGIFVMVITIISLIVFFVLISSENPELHDAAITVASLTELSLYCITGVAVLIGMCQVRTLWYDTTRKLELDNLLLVVAQTGVFIYSAFCIIGAFFQLEDHLLAFLASLATLIQTTLQTVFILDASSRFAYCAEQVKKKPGREMVTFLLVCNLAMWAINTLETNRADSHPIQVKFYGGDWAWPIITHVSMPLAIFYRFHSTVCLCEIWKKSFKYKPSNLAYV